MKILVLAVHYEVTAARYITNALTRLGHDVKHVGSEYRLQDAWGASVPDKYIWKSDRLDYDWQPDLIIIADTNTEKRVVHGFKGVPVIKWIVDNHVRNVREDGIAHYFLSHAHGPAQPVIHDDETWLPCATDATQFTPSPIPYDQREYDVCMVGVMYPRRIQLIERLRAEGFKVFAATGLVYDEYRDAYHNSRMSLCVSAAGDVAQRVFETASMGCVVLTDPLLDLSDDATASQLQLSGFSVYWSDDELVDRVREFLTTERSLAAGVTQVTPRMIAEKHTWDARAQVVIDWYERTYGKVTQSLDVILNPDGTVQDTPLNIGKRLPDGSTFHVGDATDPQSLANNPIKIAQLPNLNLGCGKTHLPSAKPAGHELVPDDIYQYNNWVNIDKVEGVGADLTFDIFQYPWPLPDSSFDGALAAHLVEHCPHEIKIAPEFEGTSRAKELSKLQDGWIAFWSELYRVLTPNALVYVVSPYGFSDGGITDFSHHRYLTANSFTHSMTPEISDGSTFKYNNGGIDFRVEKVQYRMTPFAQELFDYHHKYFSMETLLGIYNNICYDFLVRLKCVK